MTRWVQLDRHWLTESIASGALGAHRTFDPETGQETTSPHIRAGLDRHEAAQRAAAVTAAVAAEVAQHGHTLPPEMTMGAQPKPAATPEVTPQATSSAPADRRATTLGELLSRPLFT